MRTFIAILALMGLSKMGSTKAEMEKLALDMEEPKFPEPAILLVDFDPEISEKLSGMGYNIDNGTFGYPYKANPNANRGEYDFVRWNASLPSVEEKDVIVINTKMPQVRDSCADEIVVIKDQKIIYKLDPSDTVDPRGLHYWLNCHRFEKALDRGSIIIFLLGVPKYCEYYISSPGYRPGKFHEVSPFPVNILSSRRINLRSEHGKIISPVDKDMLVCAPMIKRLKSGEFFAIIEAAHRSEVAFTAFAKNKSGDIVAGGVASLGKDNKGIALFFPQLNDIQGFLEEMLADVLPALRPELFPYTGKPHWKDSEDYGHPDAIRLKKEIQGIKAEAEEKVKMLTTRIDDIRSSNAYLLDLMAGTGDHLTSAVMKTFEVLGFSPIDSDKELKKAGSNIKMEDLRLEEPGKPIVLVETKGVSQKISDEDAQAVDKYIHPRMRQWKTTEVIGLSIINQHRNVPPLQRDNETPFRQLVLTNAETRHFGLMTSFDLYRLARSFVALNWKSDQVKPIFYKAGRIHPIPIHYQPIGIVKGYSGKSKAVGFSVDYGVLKIGDRIAFELPLEFVEQEVNSIQIDGKSVSIAEMGLVAGVLTDFDKYQMAVGVRVFLAS